jgi:hypothetical protein
MKPLGISLTLDSQGLPRMRCPQPTRAEDAIWEAVRLAVIEGWTPARFKEEVAQSWAQELEDQKKDVMEELRK